MFVYFFSSDRTASRDLPLSRHRQTDKCKISIMIIYGLQAFFSSMWGSLRLGPMIYLVGQLLIRNGHNLYLCVSHYHPSLYWISHPLTNHDLHKLYLSLVSIIILSLDVVIPCNIVYIIEREGEYHACSASLRSNYVVPNSVVLTTAYVHNLLYARRDFKHSSLLKK